MPEPVPRVTLHEFVAEHIPDELSTSPSDLRVSERTPVCAGSMDALYIWLGRRRVTRTFPRHRSWTVAAT